MFKIHVCPHEKHVIIETEQGHKIRLEDTGKRILIQDYNGNKVEWDTPSNNISSVAQNNINETASNNINEVAGSSINQNAGSSINGTAGGSINYKAPVINLN